MLVKLLQCNYNGYLHFSYYNIPSFRYPYPALFYLRIQLNMKDAAVCKFADQIFS